MAALIHYRFPAARALIGPLALGVVALGAAAFVSGIHPPIPSRASVSPAKDAVRYQYEVTVKNVGRGCRWQYTADPNAQTAECGDETENVRVVFHDGQVTEYRIVPRLDPAAKATPGTTPAAVRSLLTGTPAANVAGATAEPANGANGGAPAGAPPSR
jgi:hypothetical protein